MAERMWIILAGGEWCPLHRLQPLLDSATCVVACDGALNLAQERGIDVNVVLGDMDSVHAGSLQRHLERGGEVWELSEQDDNDLAKALTQAAEHDVDKCVVVGATGGDVHHAWANLLECSRAPMEVDCLGANEVHRFIKPSRNYSIELGTGSVFSVFTLSEARGVFLRGAEWELEGANLAASSRGLHNRATAASIEIEFETGQLFVVHGSFGD